MKTFWLSTVENDLPSIHSSDVIFLQLPTLSPDSVLPIYRLFAECIVTHSLLEMLTFFLLYLTPGHI